MNDYRRAWVSNRQADIAMLFTEDASYFSEPHAEPWRGRDEIVRRWLEHQDDPGVTEFTWTPLVLKGDLAIVQGRTRYRTTTPATYSNLWVLRFAEDGRCREFTEWWMEQR